MIYRLLSLWGIFLIWLGILGVSAGLSHSVISSPWPSVRETEVVLRFTYGAPYFGIRLPIYSTDGQQRLYTLDCTGGNLAYLDRLSDKTGMNMVGPMMCTLVKGVGIGGGNLLSEGAYYDNSWFTRGYFPSDIFERFIECRHYPDYGAERAFRLRGIRLDITIERPKWDVSSVDKYEMRISVRNDPASVTPTAEPSIYRNPFSKGGNCRKVKVGIEAVLSPIALMRVPEKFLLSGPMRVAGVLNYKDKVLRLLPDVHDRASTLRGEQLSIEEEKGIVIEWRKGVELPAGCYGKSVVMSEVVFDMLEDGVPVLKIPGDFEEIYEVRTNNICWKKMLNLKK